MDVGHPSNFERMLWLYHQDRDAMRCDVAASVHADEEVKTTIKQVFERRGYLLDPHSAIAYMGLRSYAAGAGGGWRAGSPGSSPTAGASAFSAAGTVGIFLATAHPAKFGEVVEPIIGRPVAAPALLAEVLARPRHVLKISATFAAVCRTLDA
jgi:threonine synthase